MYQGHPSKTAPHISVRRAATPPAPRPHGRPTGGAAPAVASALKVKNFRRLVEALGDEQLAVRLDLPLQRIKEMEAGFNLTDEIAYHVETALGLQTGFIDQVNPKLTPADIERLNAAPVEQLIFEPAPAPATPARSMLSVPATPAPVKAAAPAQAAAPLSDEATLREIRRSNLMLLTSTPGTKSQLGRLTGLSAANMSHRLHGNKLFDQLTADMFCEKVGLPKGWFDTPQTMETLPPQVLRMLLDKNSVPFESDLLAKPIIGAKPIIMAKPAQAKAPAKPKAAAPAAPRPAPAQASLLPSAGVPSGLTRSTARPNPPASLPMAAPAPAAPTIAPVLAAAPVAAVRPPSVTAPATQPAPASATRMAKPIVDALMSTLALKSSEGRLSEEQALQLLVQVAAL